MDTINYVRQIQNYQHYLDLINDPDDYDTEAMRSVFARELIANHWSELSESQQQEVLKLDDILAQNWEIVATILPLLSSTPENRAQGRWWLFLDEGPQVRETIGKA